MKTCPDPITMLQYLTGSRFLDNEERDEIEAHLVDCRSCQEQLIEHTVAALERATAAATAGAPRPVRAVGPIGRVPWILSAVAVALAVTGRAGCHPAACIRQSDCPAPLVCSSELVCVAPPTDDAGADGGDAGGAVVVGDLGPGLCTVALRCEVFAAWGERAKQCEGALAPDQVAKVHNELACVLAGCPIDCATQLNNVELRDPAACWGCASQKLGNLCVVECP